MLGNKLSSVAAAVLLTTTTLIPNGSAATAGCGKAPTLHTGTHTITVNGTERTYILQLPDAYASDVSTPHKLFFGMHWLNGKKEDVYANSWFGLRPLANGTATVFVAPQGIDDGWANPNGTDVALVDAILARLSDALCLDERHAYSIGFSYGAAFTRALACARPAVFRAVAALSAGEFSGCDGGTEPVAFLGQHGVNDTVIPVDVGRTVRDMWVRNNGCEVPAEEPPAPDPLSLQWNKTVYAGCAPDKPVWWIAHGGGHWALPDGGAGGLSFAPAQFWEFFSQFE